MAYKARDPLIRFWNKVAISSPDKCWEWTASKYYNGYGQFFDGKNKICAHRFAYKDRVGTIPEGLVICHKCDNRGCVNPEHLFVGTQGDNIADMYAKNRNNNGDTKGSLNGRAVVSEKQVLEMREAYRKGISMAEIARSFGTSETQTARIVKKQSWKHIQDNI